MKINQLNKNGLREGLWELMRHDGSLMMKGAYVDGIKHGRWEDYYQGYGSSVGTPASEGDWEMGRKVGVWKYYRHGGHLEGRIFYVSGIEHGFREAYFRDGGFKSKGFYKNKRRSGIWFINSIDKYEEF
jgi:antitoxin component YwqK of YwqJK toxin-antitoxin module